MNATARKRVRRNNSVEERLSLPELGIKPASGQNLQSDWITDESTDSGKEPSVKFSDR
jgi:hypothetical protein